MSSSEYSSEDESSYTFGNNFYRKILINKYVLLKKIGCGVSSCVWLGYEFSKRRLVAIKITNDEHFFQGAEEIKILKKLKKNKSTDIITFIEYFIIGAKNIYSNYGTKIKNKFNKNKYHIVMVFELLGGTLDSLIENEKKFNIDTIKKIMITILKALDTLHTKIRAAHTDIKSQNIYFTNIPKQYKVILKIMNDKKWDQLLNKNRIIYCVKNKLNLKKDKSIIFSSKRTNLLLNNIFKFHLDFLENKKLIFHPDKDDDDIYQQFIDKLSTNNISVKLGDLGSYYFLDNDFDEDIQSKIYKSPEVILSYHEYSEKCDIWSLGCVFFELLTSQELFGEIKNSSQHLEKIQSLFGKIPKDFLDLCDNKKKFYNEDYSLKKKIFKSKIFDLRYILKKSGYKDKLNDNLVNLLETFFILEPNKRPSAKDLVKIFRKF